MLSVTFERLLDPTADSWQALMALYSHTFERSQRETEAAILHNLRTPENRREGGHIVISATKTDHNCLGGIIFSSLTTVECGYVSYVFVEEASRKQGLGSQLLAEMRAYLEGDARARSARMRGIFAEIQREGSDNESQSRVRFWQHYGVRPLAVEWHYPSLQNELAPVPTYLAFGPYCPGGEVWHPMELERVARAIFDATYSYLTSASSTLELILRSLRRLPRDVPVAYALPTSH